MKIHIWIVCATLLCTGCGDDIGGIAASKDFRKSKSNTSKQSRDISPLDSGDIGGGIGVGLGAGGAGVGG